MSKDFFKPIPGDSAVHLLPPHCSHHQRPPGFSCDKPEPNAINIDNGKLAQIQTLLNQTTDSFHSFPAQLCRILSDELNPCDSISVLEAFRKIIVKYPCHVCHKDILKAILTAVNTQYIKELKSPFRCQVLSNTDSNRDILNTEIVALSTEIYAESSSDIILNAETIMNLNLLGIFETLIIRYGHEWKICKNTDSKVCKILTSALWMYKSVTLYLEIVGYKNYCPNDRAVLGLVKAFEFDAHLVLEIACNIICSNSTEPVSCESDLLQFYDSFTKLLFEEKAWESNPFYASRYVKTVSKLSETFFRQLSDFEGMIRKKSRYYENIATMIIVAPSLENHGTVEVYDIIIRGVLDIVYERDLVDDLLELFYKRILSFLNQELSQFEHEVKSRHDGRKLQDKFKYKYKSAPEVTCRTNNKVSKDDNAGDSSELMEKIVKTVEILFRQRLVQKFNMDFLRALISVVRSDKIYNSGSYILGFVLDIMQRNILSRREILCTDIVKTIFDVINVFHNDCTFCDYGFEAMAALLDFLTPTGVRQHTYRIVEQSPDQLVLSIPYVVRTNDHLIEVMYPTGFNKLTELLQHGNGIESLYTSLYMVSQTINTPQPILDEPNSISQVPASDNEDTKIFLLDDGTKIRCNIAHLVEHSAYFSSLLDGRFREATLEEIPIRDITQFQFHFLVKFVGYSFSQFKIARFDMDLETHVEMIVLCDKLSLECLCRHVTDSLRWSCMMAPEELLDLYETGLIYGFHGLRNVCVDFALACDDAASKVNMLQTLFEEVSDRKTLAEDVNKWLMFKSNRPKIKEVNCDVQES